MGTGNLLNISIISNWVDIIHSIVRKGRGGWIDPNSQSHAEDSNGHRQVNHKLVGGFAQKNTSISEIIPFLLWFSTEKLVDIQKKNICL